MANKKRFPNKKPKIDNYKPPFPDGVLAEPVANLSLREETLNLLVSTGYSTILDVVKRCETDFYKICKFNKKNLLDVKNAVKKKNLFLKPLPVKENVETKPVQTAPNGVPNAQKQQPKKADNGKNQGKNGNQPQHNPNGHQNPQNERKNSNKQKNSVPYVMTTIPEKPPKPTKVVIKEESDRYVKINKNGLWGFRDRNAKDMAVPAVYDEVFNFKEDICCVQKGEKFGYVNRHGEEIIPIIYDCATSFSEGLACVFKGETCGYINTSGETVIDFKYDAGTPVIGGECRVKKSGKWGELHIDNPSEIRWII